MGKVSERGFDRKVDDDIGLGVWLNSLLSGCLSAVSHFQLDL